MTVMCRLDRSRNSRCSLSCNVLAAAGHPRHAPDNRTFTWSPSSKIDALSLAPYLDGVDHASWARARRRMEVRAGPATLRTSAGAVRASSAAKSPIMECELPEDFSFTSVSLKPHVRVLVLTSLTGRDGDSERYNHRSTYSFSRHPSNPRTDGIRGVVYW